MKHREGSNGLLILEGSYGHASVQIDVTIPLQALVKDSTLRMDSTASKSNFTGFYDPCLGQEKTLRIRYLFHSQIHSVAYRDTEAILLPNEGEKECSPIDRSSLLFDFRSFTFVNPSLSSLFVHAFYHLTPKSLFFRCSFDQSLDCSSSLSIARIRPVPIPLNSDSMKCPNTRNKPV